MAHALGAAGLLGTVALAIAAFAPRLSLVSDKVREHWFDVPASHPVLPIPPQAPPAAPPASVAELPQAATANAVEPPAVLAPTTPETPPAPAPTTPETPPAPAPTTPETLPAPASTTPEKTPAPQVTVTAAEHARLASVPRPARPEPPLTPREIERRKQRYELWLRREGLERIH
jgi:hypothetical protein